MKTFIFDLLGALPIIVFVAFLIATILIDWTVPDEPR